jgi:TolB-like protein
VAVILLLLAVGVMVWFRPGSPPHAEGPATAGASAEVVEPANEPRARSIAVLPFVNMSSDPEQEYFSDGISEEILNVLARQPELQVAARTSSFSFKGGKQEVPEIAKALNVRMVLEGSVRKQANQVRITAQLIDASSGFHLWSETYERELADLFAIQDEIAAAIAKALQVTLAASNADQPVAQRNIEAYDLYLRGLALWQQRGRGEPLWQAIELFEQSLAIEPDNLDALGGLALAYAVIADYSERISTLEADLLAVDHALRALVSP